MRIDKSHNKVNYLINKLIFNNFNFFYLIKSNQNFIYINSTYLLLLNNNDNFHLVP